MVDIYYLKINYGYWFNNEMTLNLYKGDKLFEDNKIILNYHDLNQ